MSGHFENPNGHSTRSQVVALYVPCGSEEEAAGLAGTLLSERLIACGNIYPSRSLFMWKGELSDEREYVLLCKTARSRADAAERRITELHSYEIPCIIRLNPENVNRSYEAWVLEQVAGPPPSERRGQRTQDQPNSASTSE